MVTALGGSEIATGHGTVTPSGDVTVALNGTASTSGIGDVTDGFELPLTGSEILGEQDTSGFGLPKNVELSGAEVAVEDGTVYLDNDRTYPLTTSVSNTELGTLPVFVNAFVNGETIFTEMEGIGPRTADLTGQEITVEQARLHTGGQKPAGDPRKDKGKDKRKKRHCTINIDGQEFVCDSKEEVEDLFAQARMLAKQRAKEDADAQLAKLLEAKDKETKVQLKVPRITGSDELKDEITAIYNQATIDAQVALEVSRKQQLDEEESLVLLLLN